MTLLSDLVGIPTLQSVSSLQADNAALVSQLSALQTQMTAVVSQTVYGEGDLGALSWAGTAPSGTITKRYRFSKTGRLVTLDWNIRASVAGLLVSAVATALPAGLPAPQLLANVPQNSLAVPGAGGILASVSANLTGGQAGLYRLADVSGLPAYELRITSGLSLAAVAAQGQLQYLTATL